MAPALTIRGGASRHFLIDLIRASAFLLVLVFHLSPTRFWWGSYGVDVFFLLSGFLLASNFQRLNSTVEVLLWGRQRLRRLYIPILCVCVVLPFLAAICDQVELVTFVKQLLTVFGISFYNFGQDLAYFDVPRAHAFGYHFWSVWIEVQFSIVVIVIALVAKSPWTRHLVLVTISILSFFAWLNSEDGRGVDYYSFICRLWQFGLGAFLYGFALIKLERRELLAASFLMLAVVTLLVSQFFTIEAFDVHKKWAMFALCAVAMVIYLSAKTQVNSPPAVVVPIVALGKRSYTAYLLHLPVISGCYALIELVDLHMVDALSTAFSIASMMLSFSLLVQCVSGTAVVKVDVRTRCFQLMTFCSVLFVILYFLYFVDLPLRRQAQIFSICLLGVLTNFCYREIESKCVRPGSEIC